MDIRDAHTMLAGLTVGDTVTITRDGRDNVVTVQRAIRRMDGGGFGSWDHAAVTVGYGPGRWNTEVTAAGIAAGHYSVSIAECPHNELAYSATSQWCETCGVTLDPEDTSRALESDR